MIFELPLALHSWDADDKCGPQLKQYLKGSVQKGGQYQIIVQMIGAFDN